ALVPHTGPAWAAAPAARLSGPVGDPWPELNAGLRRAADELAGRASRGELALFLGAGVSAGAGLPLWSELLRRLAEKAGMTGDWDRLRRLGVLDQASIIEKRLRKRKLSL